VIKILIEAPEQINVDDADTARVMSGPGVTVMVSSSVSWIEHVPLLATTLKVVVVKMFPVGRFKGPPFPG
jgi:hypothetical protein